MKKITAVLTIVLFLSGAFAGTALNVNAEEGEFVTAASGDYEYEITHDGKLKITNYTGSETSIVIPSTLDGHTVKLIGSSAFREKGLVSVTIPSTVYYIDWYAFYGNNISSLTMHDNIYHIDDYAFSNNNLDSVTMPFYIWNIGMDAFAGNNFSKFTLPASVESWQSYSGTTYGGGAQVSVSGLYRKNMLYEVETDGEGTCGVERYNGTSTDIVIPSEIYGMTVTEITGLLSEGLTSVVLPNTIEEIGTMALSYNKLTSIVIPDSVKTIGDIAFRYNKLTSIVYSDSLEQIGDGAFNNNAITSINGQPSKGFVYGRKWDYQNQCYVDNKTIIASYGGTAKVIDFIPDDVVGIRTQAFADCGITSVTFPDGLEYIHWQAFKRNNLSGVSLPKSLFYLGYRAFEDNNFSNVRLPATEYEWISGEGVVYSGGTSVSVNYHYETIYQFSEIGSSSKYQLVYYQGTDTDIVIPDTYNGHTVVNINNPYFKNKGLNSVVIPDTILYIGYSVFSGNNFTHITLPAGSGDWMDSYGNIFSGGDSVPVDSLYQSVKLDYDLNNDWAIDMLDIAVLAQEYHNSNIDIDQNQDGVIDIFDMVILARYIN